MMTMKKFHTILQNYLLLGFPFVLFLIVWAPFTDMASFPKSGFGNAAMELLSFHLLIWFIMLFVFFILLTISTTMRDKTLIRIANIKERDEREMQITGIAARNTYISTISLLIVLLLFSVINLNIQYLPKEEQINGNTKSIAVGTSLKFFDQPDKEIKRLIFGFNQIPLTKTGIILLILIWQIAAFNWNARRAFDQA